MIRQRVSVARVTRSLHGVLQVSPQIGRWFTAAEDAPGGPAVAILLHGLWTRRFGRDPTIIGRLVALNGVTMEVVGVMPPSFAFPDSRVGVWVPEPLTRAAGFGLFTHVAVARCARACRSLMRNDLDAVISDLPQLFPGSPLALSLARDREPLRSVAITLKEATVGQVERALWVLLGSVGVVLLVACQRREPASCPIRGAAPRGRGPAGAWGRARGDYPVLGLRARFSRSAAPCSALRWGGWPSVSW